MRRRSDHLLSSVASAFVRIGVTVPVETFGDDIPGPGDAIELSVGRLPVFAVVLRSVRERGAQVRLLLDVADNLSVRRVPRATPPFPPMWADPWGGRHFEGTLR